MSNFELDEIGLNWRLYFLSVTHCSIMALGSPICVDSMEREKKQSAREKLWGT